jgi:F-type H+-transporting ATPase subunit b
MEPILQSLGINIPSVIWHLINFVILIWILQRFLYRPVLRMLDERSNRIRESLAHAEEVQNQTARLEQESRTILEEARREGLQITTQARTNAERIVAEATQRAQQEADRLVERTKQELARERDQVFQELREQIADLTVTAAGHVIRRSLDDATHRQLVREFLASDAGDGRSN